MSLFLDAVTVLQHAVDAVEDVGNIVGRADVDVGCHLAHSVHHDQFHQFGDDGARYGAGGLSQC